MFVPKHSFCMSLLRLYVSSIYVTQTAIFHTLVCANGDVNNDRVCAFRFFVIYADSPKGTDVLPNFPPALCRFFSASVEWSLCVFWFTNSGNLGTFHIFLNAKNLFSLFFPFRLSYPPYC